MILRLAISDWLLIHIISHISLPLAFISPLPSFSLYHFTFSLIALSSDSQKDELYYHWLFSFHWYFHFRPFSHSIFSLLAIIRYYWLADWYYWQNRQLLRHAMLDEHVIYFRQKSARCHIMLRCFRWILRYFAIRHWLSYYYFQRHCRHIDGHYFDAIAFAMTLLQLLLLFLSYWYWYCHYDISFSPLLRFHFFAELSCH